MALVALSPIRKAHWVYSGAIPNCCNTGTKMKAMNVHLAVADTIIKLITAVNRIKRNRTPKPPTLSDKRKSAPRMEMH